MYDYWCDTSHNCDSRANIMHFLKTLWRHGLKEAGNVQDLPCKPHRFFLLPVSLLPFLFLSNSWRIKMTIFKISVPSTTDRDVTYTIIVDTELKTVDCDCKSGRIRGYCKHIRSYKVLIRQLLAE